MSAAPDCVKFSQFEKIRLNLRQRLIFVECVLSNFDFFGKFYQAPPTTPSFSADYIVASSQIRPSVGPAHVLAPVEGGLRSSQDEVPCSSYRKWSLDGQWRQSPQTTRRGHRRLLRKGGKGRMRTNCVLFVYC